jgi:3-oxoacyl-[acyl-carrier-protein] synthase-1
MGRDALAFSIKAAREAIEQAGWTQLTDRDGFIFATTTGQIPIWDQALVDFLHNRIEREAFELAFVHQPLGVLLDEVALTLGHTGPSLLVTSACAASTQAIGLASLWISQKKVDRCLVIGAEVLCTLTTEGFKSLQLLSAVPAKPFDINRSGINLSEGAAALCLEGESARANWRAVIRGFGMSSDGHHMTGPHPEGRGVVQAVQTALQTAALLPSDISWVHAHGTGSPQNDSAEGAALAQVFGETMPWVSSTKWLHGHSLGASGILETVLCIEALDHQTVLRTAGLETADTKIQIKHPTKNFKTPLRHILKTTLGFGGVNAALVISQPEASTCL